jgi:hypothetical protein
MGDQEFKSKEFYRKCVGLGNLKERPRPSKRAVEPNKEYNRVIQKE